MFKEPACSSSYGVLTLGWVLRPSSHLVFLMLCSAFKGTSEISFYSACGKLCHIYGHFDSPVYKF